MQPYPWWTLYLEPPFCVRFGILHLIAWFRWGSLFLFKIQSSKLLNNCFFLAVGTILVLVAACFYSKFNSKKVLQIWFFQLLAQSWFQWQLFSSQNSIQKSIEKFIFQLLARSWFWRQFFSAKNCKKIQKGYLLQTQPYPWWTPYLEPPFCIRFGLVHLIRMRQDEIRDMMCCVFMEFSKILPKKRKNIKMIPPPNAAIPLVNPILRTSLLCIPNKTCWTMMRRE